MSILAIQLKEYADKADVALYALHNAVRIVTEHSKDERWREIYKARCDIASLMAQVIKESDTRAPETEHD